MKRGAKGKQFRIGYKRLLRPVTGAMLFLKGRYIDPLSHVWGNCIFIKTMTIFFYVFIYK